MKFTVNIPNRIIQIIISINTNPWLDSDNVHMEVFASVVALSQMKRETEPRLHDDGVSMVWSDNPGLIAAMFSTKCRHLSERQQKLTQHFLKLDAYSIG